MAIAADHFGGPASRPGFFITLEGGEGTGKSTQARRLCDRLVAAGREVVTTREPGGSPRAERIRALLLEGRGRSLGPFGEAALFAAARLDHVKSVIEPALARNAVVICDRFTDSTRVYQGVLAGVAERRLAGLDRASAERRADLTLLLDVSAEIGTARAAARGEGRAPDRFEAESLAFHERVRTAFLAIAAGDPERCTAVDASGSPDAVEAAIWAVVEPRLARVFAP